MIRFECDYSEGCIDKIQNALAETNLDQTVGYGMDPHCERARDIIRRLCGREDAEVQFLVGGTQANMTLIAAALRPHQGVLAAETGHVNVHESGAIEATGHKVLALPANNGKISAEQVGQALHAHFSDPHSEHMVQPGLVYLSEPTEVGTIYTADELRAISAACRRYGAYLYIDGARLGYAMAACPEITFPLLAEVADAFYIGGTKVGALFGEAMVILNPVLKKDFRYILKQRGGMLAKGRLLGIQFECLLEDDTYLRISRHAVSQAMRIRQAALNAGWSLYVDSPTNQQFFTIPDDQLAILSRRYTYDLWEHFEDGRTAVRFCASWATPAERVDELIRDIAQLSTHKEENI